MTRKGKPQRPVNSAGWSGKQFKRVVPRRKKVRIPAHPLIVVQDLRAGSLATLDRYLKRNKGIPDREVAVELRKLLSGTASRSKFRLVVVDHPDAPPDSGGRPRSRSKLPSPEEWDLVDEYRAQLAYYDKKGIAKDEAARVFGVSVSTVIRAIRKVEASEAAERRLIALCTRRERALANLRIEKRED